MFAPNRRWRVERKNKVSETSRWRIRFIVLRGLVLLIFFVLAAQLWRMQVVEGERYQERAEYNRLRLLPINPKRGVIYDRNGVLLVRNAPSFTVAVVPADLPTKLQPQVVARLAALLQMSPTEINDVIEKQRAEQRLFTSAPIKTNVDRDTAFIIEENRRYLPGISLLIEPTRRYLEGSAMAHLLGYVGRISAEEYDQLKDAGYDLNDRIGKSGVEHTYEAALRGKPGREQVVVNVSGQKLETLQSEPSIPGNNLVLTIDIELQREMTRILAESMGDSKHAAAVAMNPQTGEVLGMVSLPAYDNNVFSGPLSQEDLNKLLQDPQRPLMNYAISGVYPPGSIFKVVTGSGALQEGVANRNTIIVSTGEISLVNQYDPSIVYHFLDWAALGALNFVQGIAYSSDVYFYHLAGGYRDFQGLGIERLARYAKEFGLGARTKVDLLGEAPGLVPDPLWKKEALNEPWLTGDTYNMGIGQGFLQVSPLQMANVVSAIANGGTLLQPQVVKEIIDGNGWVVVPFSKKVIRKLSVAPQYLDIMKEGMRKAVEWGTATLAQVKGVTVAGKTGTAEYGAIDPVTGHRPTHGWFISFAPVENPQIALVVFHERGQGALTAAPAAGKILQYYFDRLAAKAH